MQWLVEELNTSAEEDNNYHGTIGSVGRYCELAEFKKCNTSYCLINFNHKNKQKTKQSLLLIFVLFCY